MVAGWGGEVCRECLESERRISAQIKEEEEVEEGRSRSAETEGLPGLEAVWRYQSRARRLTDTRRWLETEPRGGGGWQRGLDLHRGEPTSGEKQGQKKIEEHPLI